MSMWVVVRCPECGSWEVTGKPEEVADGIFHCSECGVEFDYLEADFALTDEEVPTDGR